jgi:hypothetical protein
MCFSWWDEIFTIWRFVVQLEGGGFRSYSTPQKFYPRSNTLFRGWVPPNHIPVTSFSSIVKPQWINCAFLIATIPFPPRAPETALEGLSPNEYMGARERGKRTIENPLALQPVPIAASRSRSRDFLIFSCGFWTALFWILWLLWPMASGCGLNDSPLLSPLVFFFRMKMTLPQLQPNWQRQSTLWQIFTPIDTCYCSLGFAIMLI